MKMIELSGFLPKIGKTYSDEIYKDFKSLNDEDKLFMFFRDDSLVVFNQYDDPKVSIYNNDITKKLRHLRPIENKDKKDYDSLISDLKAKSKMAISKENSFSGIREFFPDMYKKDNLRINISNYCSLSCKYCFQKTKNNKRLPWEDCKKQIDSFMENHQHLKTINTTVCMTSEPFLDLDYIKKIYYYIQGKCLDKLKKETSKEELYSFLGISSDQEYEEILCQRDYYKSAFSNMDSRFISEKIRSKLDYVLYCNDIDEVKEINREVIYSVLSSSKNMYYLWFCTNGTITPDLNDLTFLKSLFSKASMGISLDGDFSSSKSRVYRNGKTSYNEVIKNIKLFQNNGIQLEVHCTITEDNCDFLKLIKFFKKEGLTNVHFNFKKSMYSPKVIKNLEKLFKAYKNGKVDSLYGMDAYLPYITENLINWSHCYACDAYCIGYDNKTYFCDYFVNKGIDLSEADFSKISILNRPDCQKCKFKLVCGSTCFASTNGKLDKDPVACRLNEEYIKHTLFYLC